MEFIKRSKRIFRVATKPTKKEYTTVAKITGLGMVLIGVIGYLITIVARMLGA